jgi:GH25 family lysozyme M1 (1,4-beta-N-acetylmuramidase)
MPMALGIDIYRYQTVTDWNAVKRHGVSFVYVKGTDGGGPAIVRGDAQVRGAQSVGIPVGLYHYAQLSPSPEVQADVLTGEVRRLGALGLPPALDLEDPHRPGAAARDFVFRFLTRLRANGFDSVTLYANTSMLNGITADTIGVPNTVIWAAAYGPNDGRRHPLNYRGRVNIHQYTSVGGIPGISGQVDLNESLTPLPSGGDVELTESMRAFIWPHNDEIQDTVGSTLANTQSYARTLSTVQVPALMDAMGQLAQALADIEAIKTRALAELDETALLAEMESRGISGVTPAQLKEVVMAAALRARTNGD